MKSKLLPYWRFVKYHLFGVKHFKRRLPRKGDLIYACCPSGERKIVNRVSVFEDTIEYTDGTSDSIKHCGWYKNRKDR